jgi:hypothetical protein
MIYIYVLYGDNSDKLAEFPNSALDEAIEKFHAFVSEAGVTNVTLEWDNEG